MAKKYLTKLILLRKIKSIVREAFETVILTFGPRTKSTYLQYKLMKSATLKHFKLLSFQLVHTDESFQIFAQRASGLRFVSPKRLDGGKVIQSVKSSSVFHSELKTYVAPLLLVNSKEWKTNTHMHYFVRD